MTPEQEAFVEAMLDLFVRGGKVKDTFPLADAGLITVSRMYEDEILAAASTPATGPVIVTSLGAYKVNITEAGNVVLALAVERDLWRLKAELLEASQKYDQTWHDFPGQPTESESRYLSDVAERYRQAKAAYVAAGGVV